MNSLMLTALAAQSGRSSQGSVARKHGAPPPRLCHLHESRETAVPTKCVAQSLHLRTSLPARVYTLLTCGTMFTVEKTLHGVLEYLTAFCSRSSTMPRPVTTRRQGDRGSKHAASASSSTTNQADAAVDYTNGADETVKLCGEPVREHQQLLVQQGMISLLVDVITCPFADWGGPHALNDLSEAFRQAQAAQHRLRKAVLSLQVSHSWKHTHNPHTAHHTQPSPCSPHTTLALLTIHNPHPAHHTPCSPHLRVCAHVTQIVGKVTSALSRAAANARAVVRERRLRRLQSTSAMDSAGGWADEDLMTETEHLNALKRICRQVQQLSK